MEQQQEQVFYKNGQVHISQSRLIVYNKTYMMRNIASFTIVETKPNRTVPIVLLCMGAIAAFPGDVTKYCAVVFMLTGIIWLLTLRDEYGVRISSSSGETGSIVSDKQDIQAIVNALHEAFIFWGRP